MPKFARTLINALLHPLLWGAWGGLLLLASCSDAEKFYGVLDIQPEIYADYNAVYSIDDTLTVKGRLNPENNLIIRIGDAEAEILKDKTEKVAVANNRNGLTIDVVKVLITEDMGIGDNRPVTITSAGITVSAPGIDIVGDVDAAILDKPLQLVRVADIPSGSKPVYCRSGNGNVYTFSATGKKLFKIDAQDGSITELFNESRCIDGNGAFTIEQFNAGAVSPDEKYFYFSAKVKETEQSRTLELYKLCRYELPAGTLPEGELTVLNRTEYSLLEARRTFEAAQPFEGNIYDVEPAKRPKIYKINRIWTHADGRVFFEQSNNFFTSLDNAGNYTYLLNIVNAAADIPEILNPATGKYYSAMHVHLLLPGAKLKYPVSYLDPENERIYSETRSLGKYSLTLIDMKTCIVTGSYPDKKVDVNNREIPYFTTSLKRFNGGLVDYNGFTPLIIEGKLYNIFFTDLLNLQGNAKEFYQNYALPAICVVDLDNSRADRLAPGKLDYNGFTVFKLTDRMLNFDSDKMLYMTVNNGTVLVKTKASPSPSSEGGDVAE